MKSRIPLSSKFTLRIQLGQQTKHMTMMSFEGQHNEEACEDTGSQLPVSPALELPGLFHHQSR